MSKPAVIPAWADKSSAQLTTADSQPAPAAKAKPSGGSWPGLGVSPALSKALVLRGFKSPTPIQRTTLPSTLASPPRDVLGMARTGSGKTLAYIIPLIQRITARLGVATGPKALILCPTRELALQIHRVGKDLGRGILKSTKGSAIKWALVMGGDSLEAQFEMLTDNPDIIIATPGRLLHLIVEMSYDLRSVEMVIYDEADRLFEMGFEVQLHEILHRLPSHRQNLLFSATLPSAVAEFAKAGLTNPLLHRLDSEQKISEDLQLEFFDVKKGTNKDAALLALLESLIHVVPNRDDNTKSNQAIVFVSTKHHVEYMTTLLTAAGYRANHIYGSLDQVARQQQLSGFRSGQADLLVVTDVAARGIDIPIMDNVINYDFPTGVKSFIHRVGRTARAGRKGTAWSFVTRDDMPYAIDLESFLRLDMSNPTSNRFWAIPQDIIDQKVEQIAVLDETSPDLPTLRAVMERGRSMFERSRTKASSKSHKESKDRRKAEHQTPPHPAFPAFVTDSRAEQQSRLLATLEAFTPNETILELGQRGQNGNVGLMTARRQVIANRSVARVKKARQISPEAGPSEPSQKVSTRDPASYRDENHYIDHTRAGAIDDQGYSMNNPNFVDQVSKVTFDMTQDEGAATKTNRPSQLKWDRKKKKMVAGDGIGADNKKMIRSESGALLPASYKSGRFDEWRKSKRVSQSRKPSSEEPTARSSDRTYRHKARPAKADARTEIKSASQIVNTRKLAEKRKAKNQRPSKRR